MKYSILKFLIFYFLLIPITVNAEEEENEEYKEGIHYKILNNREWKKNTILKGFSVYCRLCYGTETAFKYMADSLPSDVEYSEIHMTGGGRFLDIPGELLAINKDNYSRVKEILYQAIFEEKITKVSEFYNYVLPKIGITVEDYNKKRNNPALQQEIYEDNTECRSLAGKFGLPVLLVNNQYLVNVHKLRDRDDLLKIVEFLLSKKDTSPLSAEKSQTDN